MLERAALVTGASSGIGFAIARVLGAEGLSLTVTARRSEKLAAAAERLRASGYAVESLPGNVGSDADVAEVVARHRACWGRLDVLVNNAGIGIQDRLEDSPLKLLNLQLDVNLRSVMLFYRAALPLLKKAGAEHGKALVVNTSSIVGKRGEKLLAAYSAAKHGVVGFTQAMNHELAGSGVKSCVLCPGYVDTPLSDYIKSEIPAHTMIRAEDVAEAVRFLMRLSSQCVVPEIMFARIDERH